MLAARQAITQYYRKEGATVDPEHLILTAGTSESFFSVFSLLARRGDNILTPNPAYPLFDTIAELAGVELRQYRLREEQGWQIDRDDLQRKTDEKTALIVLISPNNPTGAVATAEEIAAVVDWANQKSIPLLCDEVFSEFYFGTGKFPSGRFPRPIAVARPNLCFTLNGISKRFALPGLKLGWIAVTGLPDRVEPAVDRLETIADTFLSTHTPIQQALPRLFTEGEPFVQSYRAEVARRRTMAVELLEKIPKLRIVSPAGGFFLMAEVLKRDQSEEEFVIALMQETGVFVHPGYFYDYEHGIHFVLSFLTEPTKLRHGIETIGRFLK